MLLPLLGDCCVILELELPLKPGQIILLLKELKMSQRRQAYPPEFHLPMVELVRVGREPSELVKEFCCHEISISAWVR